MLEDGKISNQQFIFIFILCRLMLTMTYLSYFKAPPRNQDLWISGILSLPMHILLTLPVYFLAVDLKVYLLFNLPKLFSAQLENW